MRVEMAIVRRGRENSMMVGVFVRFGELGW